MNLDENIRNNLDLIKQLRGVENVVLTQRDGNPIQSAGVWFSKDEIFEVSTAASAIFNVGMHLHPHNLKYILIEGKKAKIVIAPLDTPIHNTLNKVLEQLGILNADYEYFVAVTAQPNVNLGGMFLQTGEALKEIKIALITSGESFKPPLIQFDSERIENIIERFNVKENKESVSKLSHYSLTIPEKISKELKKTLNLFASTVPGLKYAFVSIKGGFTVSEIIKDNTILLKRLDHVSAMSYSLFRTANSCAQLLRKTNAEKIVIDCDYYYQFIIGLKEGIFNAIIGKSKQKLGLLRLILPKFTTKINSLLKQASETQHKTTFEIKELLGDLIIE